MPLLVRLCILIVALIAVTSCNSSESGTNNNSVVISSSQSDGAPAKPNRPCLNLNIATPEELMKLPGIGEVMAKKIVDYRERQGRIRRPGEIIIIDGFSERKYRAIAEMICVE